MLKHTYDETGEYTIKVLGNIISTGTYSFEYENGINEIIFPEGFTSFRDQSFSHCSNLTKITLPESVTGISRACFSNCDLREINIPHNIISMQSMCFFGNENLTNVIFNWNAPENILTYDTSWFNLASSKLQFTIPRGTSSMYIDSGFPSARLVERSE